VAHLEDWENLEEEHSSALTGAMEALESTILRVPVSGGAKVYIKISLMISSCIAPLLAR